MAETFSFQVFSVGGSVRDELLGLEPKDYDYVVVGATPEQLINQGFEKVGKDFPVFLHPQTKDEWALARMERKVGIGYQSFEFEYSSDVTLEDDLIRRDLTINAIAKDLDTGEYIDPHGGQKDIQNRLLRHVSDAFVEDPVRVLRVARFYARYHHLGFTIAQETKELMAKLSESGELDTLTNERVWNEVVSALKTQTPTAFFEALREVGALKCILPEIDALWGVPQVKEHHPEVDTGIHTMMALEAICKLSDDPVTRFGVLVHDLGKAATPKELLPRHHGHEKGGVPIIEALCSRLRAPREYRQFGKLISEHHLQIHRISESRSRTIMELLTRLGGKRSQEKLIQFGLAAKADALGRLGKEKDAYAPFEMLVEFNEALNSVDMRKFDFSTHIGRVHADNAMIDAIREVKVRLGTKNLK